MPSENTLLFLILTDFKYIGDFLSTSEPHVKVFSFLLKK